MTQNLESQTLVPYTEFEAPELARELNHLVAINTGILTSRRLFGVIARYSDLDSSLEKILKAQEAEDDVRHFAVLDSTGRVQGSASIYEALPLQRLRLPIPPAFAFGPAAEDYPSMNLNVHAWTDSRQPDLLQSAYRGLLKIASGYNRPHGPSDFPVQAWTIEPSSVVWRVHKAIEHAGLLRRAEGRFDDAELRKTVPPKSILYSRILPD